MPTPQQMDGHFAGQVVIVTGAGTGIGRATAAAFATGGTQVLGIGRRPEALADSAAQHPSITTLTIDVTRDDAPDAVVRAALDRWGRVDVLVNNAGAFAAMPLEQVTPDRIRELLAVNVLAPSLLARAALPHLKATRGAIINISSTFGHRPAAGAGHYAASKAALEQLTRSWALELAPDGIRVNAVAPGPTESEAAEAIRRTFTTSQRAIACEFGVSVSIMYRVAVDHDLPDAWEDHREQTEPRYRGPGRRPRQAPDRVARRHR